MEVSLRQAGYAASGHLCWLLGKCFLGTPLLPAARQSSPSTPHPPCPGHGTKDVLKVTDADFDAAGDPRIGGNFLTNFNFQIFALSHETNRKVQRGFLADSDCKCKPQPPSVFNLETSQNSATEGIAASVPAPRAPCLESIVSAHALCAVRCSFLGAPAGRHCIQHLRHPVSETPISKTTAKKRKSVALISQPPPASLSALRR